MLLVYCQHTTKRLAYIFDLLLNKIAGIEFIITGNKEDYIQWNGASLNYSGLSLKTSEIVYSPESLLFENDVRQQNIAVDKTEGAAYLYFAKSQNKKYFDPFAAAFFLVSRYEEYLPFTPDRYERFEAASSILHKHRLLDKPLVNIWAEEIKKIIIRNFPEVVRNENQFSALISIDVDQAYAFKYRGFIKNCISLLKNVFSFKTDFIISQIKTQLNLSKDPYDSFNYLKHIQQEANLNFTYFVNLGKFSQYDKNLSASNQQLKKLVVAIQSHAHIGIHPSFYSNEFPQKFIEEKNKLEDILQTPVVKSRQHYLKIKLPTTYQHLLQAGFTEDYSMGYASCPGFRAGTCTPFKWFDLQSNCETLLTVYPITYMEGAFKTLGMPTADAALYSQKILETVKQYNGFFMSIWHNHTVTDKFTWKGWKRVFEQSLEQIKQYK